LALLYKYLFSVNIKKLDSRVIKYLCYSVSKVFSRTLTYTKYFFTASQTANNCHPRQLDFYGNKAGVNSLPYYMVKF